MLTQAFLTRSFTAMLKLTLQTTPFTAMFKQCLLKYLKQFTSQPYHSWFPNYSVLVFTEVTYQGVANNVRLHSWAPNIFDPCNLLFTREISLNG
jgi:hypothetical protein